MNTKNNSVFDEPTVTKSLSNLHDKASNNVVFVCIMYYMNCLLHELGISDTVGTNQTYQPITMFKQEILSNHMSVLHSFNIPVSDVQSELPLIYLIPELHKHPYKIDI